MSISTGRSRRHLSSRIDAAQTAPQVITKRNASVAVLVSADYFKRTKHAVGAEPSSFYDRLIALRTSYAPVDDAGLAVVPRAPARPRSNEFSQNDDGRGHPVKNSMAKIIYLANTNVVSEFVKRPPDAQVMRWLQTVGLLAVSAVTIEEAYGGLAWHPNARKASLFQAMMDWPQQYDV